MSNENLVALVDARERETEKRLLRLPEVLAITGLSRSGLYQLLKVNDFPSQVQLQARSVAWNSAQVQAWIADRISRARPARSTTTAEVQHV
jgi:prophage regulatory protein